MKKLKVLLLAAAIFIGVGGAFAGKKDPACASHPQYYRFGFNFFPAGEFGVNYFCLTSIGYCTYYQPSPGNFVPCRFGLFIPL